MSAFAGSELVLLDDVRHGQGDGGQVQRDVAAISGLGVDVAPFVGTNRERIAAVLGSRVRALSSKTADLPAETQRQAPTGWVVDEGQPGDQRLCIDRSGTGRSRPGRRPHEG